MCFGIRRSWTDVFGRGGLLGDGPNDLLVAGTDGNEI
jgi:hypothetical protein